MFFEKAVAIRVYKLNYVTKKFHIRHLSHQSNGASAKSDQQDKQFQYMTLHSVEPGQSHLKHSNNVDRDIAFRKVGLLDLAKSKLYDAQNFYDEFSGMSAVKVAQNKVIEIQNQLQVVQERRRHILLELTLVRKQLQDIHVELQNTVRGEHRYVELIKEEYNVIAQEKEKNQIFQIVDQEERELFAHLTSAVKTSHEKERTQANNVKYWSIIGSCVGALLGIIATSINYYYRNTQYDTIKKTTKDTVNKLDSVDNKLIQLGATLGILKEQIDSMKSLKSTEEQKKDSESWGSYFKRHTVGIYRYFFPHRKN